MDTESLTYRELATRLGVKLESAKKTVLRKRWQKITGNDGTLRIMVPIEALPPPDSPVDNGAYTRELEIRIDGLKLLLEAETRMTAAEARRADTAETDRDAWRTQAEQLAAKRKWFAWLKAS